MLAELSADERAITLERFRLLEPHLQDGRELRSIADRTSVSFRTLQRWVAGYKRDGLPSRPLATASSSVRPDCRLRQTIPKTLRQIKPQATG
jgi:transposase